MKKYKNLGVAVEMFQDMVDKMAKKLGSVEASCGYYTALLVIDHDLMKTPEQIYKAILENALLA